MHFLVGLGNPGREYEFTRHNAGRLVLYEALKAGGFPVQELTGSRGRSVDGEMFGKPVRVLFPDVYMNESGKAVRKFLSAEEVPNLIVFHDEVDLPLGAFKLSEGRGSGGHNGLASVISALDTRDFVRVRIGIAERNFWGRIVRPEGERLAAYVLGQLSARELKALENLTEPVKEALEVLVRDGAEAAMNRFN